MLPMHQLELTKQNTLQNPSRKHLFACNESSNNWTWNNTSTITPPSLIYFGHQPARPPWLYSNWKSIAAHKNLSSCISIMSDFLPVIVIEIIHKCPDFLRTPIVTSIVWPNNLIKCKLSIGRKVPRPFKVMGTAAKIVPFFNARKSNA